MTGNEPEISGDQGPVFCVRGCRFVELGQVCTSRPDFVNAQGGSFIVLCPPEDGCIDGCAHRVPGGEWHTCTGMGLADWFARADWMLKPGQLELFGAAS